MRYLYPHHRYEPETSMGHTLLVLCHILIQHNNFIKIEKRMKGNALKKWESTLNLCVHAHGYNVDLSCKLLVEWLSAWYKFFLHLWLGPLRLWSQPWYSPFIPFLRQDWTLVFYKSTIQFNFYLVPPSRITPWYLDDIVALHHLLEILAGAILLIVFANPHVLGCR